MSVQIGVLIGAILTICIGVVVFRSWNSFESLSKLQIAVAIALTLLGVFALTIKLRADQLKKIGDSRRAEERAQIDKELKEKTEALEAKASQRTLNPPQAAQLRQLLSNLPKNDIEFECPSDDREAAVFASSLLELFRDAGWNITTFARSQFPNGTNPRGIELGIHSPVQEEEGKAIAAALKQTGLQVRVSLGNAPQPMPFTLLVGSKP